MKPTKELIINEILSEMDFGTTYTECMQYCATKWDLKKGTFVRYWKEASESYLEANRKDKEALSEVRVEALKDRASKGILSKEERMKILSDMADGTLLIEKEIVTKSGVVRKIVLFPEYNDRRAAVAELNKMEGDYAPLKKDITTNGESIAPAPVFNIVLDDGEL